MMEHKVNDDAGNRHVEPERQRDSRYFPVTNEIESKGADKCYRDERNNHDSKNCMAGKNREVDGSSQSAALKSRCAMVVVIR